jgi:putative methyltransferase (TIGR04325 family)
MIFKKKPKYGWSGSYSTWKEVQEKSNGYNQDLIFKKVFETTKRVIEGEYMYERDSIGFNDHCVNFPLLYLLNKCHNTYNSCNVLDFGGALGSLFFQHRQHLKEIQNLEWTVIEQADFVSYSTQLPCIKEIKFSTDLDENLKTPQDILILSSVLQYIQYPEKLISLLLNHPFKYIFIDRTAFIENSKDILSLQIVPPHIYEASYPSWFFNEKKLLNQFKNYQILHEFNNCIEPDIEIDGKRGYWKGFILTLHHA